jgi:membrane protein required for colicin V production
MAAAYFFGPVLTPTMAGWLGVEDGAEAEKLFGMIPYDVLAQGLSYGAVFIIVVIILSIISHFLAEGVKSLGLGAIDRTFGFIFGMLRGVLILGLLNLPVYMYVDQETRETYTGGSKTIFYVNKTSAFVQGFIPAQTSEKMNSSMNGITETLEEQKGTFDQLNRAKQQQERFSRPADGSNNETGYDDELRNQMDKLFQEKTEDR